MDVFDSLSRADLRKRLEVLAIPNRSRLRTKPQMILALRTHRFTLDNTDAFVTTIIRSYLHVKDRAALNRVSKRFSGEDKITAKDKDYCIINDFVTIVNVVANDSSHYDRSVFCSSYNPTVFRKYVGLEDIIRVWGVHVGDNEYDISSLFTTKFQYITKIEAHFDEYDDYVTNGRTCPSEEQAVYVEESKTQDRYRCKPRFNLQVALLRDLQNAYDIILLSKVEYQNKTVKLYGEISDVSKYYRVYPKFF